MKEPENPRFGMTFLQEEKGQVANLSWHHKLSLWLKQKGRGFKTDEILPEVLNCLRAQAVRFQGTSHAHPTPTMADYLLQFQDRADSLDISCWEQDHILMNWNQGQRYQVLRQLKTFAKEKLNEKEQLWILEIITIIDQITGYSHSSFAPNAIIRRENSAVGNEKAKNEGHGKTAFSSFQKLFEAVFPASNLKSPEVERQLNDLCLAIGREGSCGKTYQILADSILEISQDSESCSLVEAQLPPISRIYPDDTWEQIRGKALCLNKFLSAGILTKAKALESTILQNGYNVPIQCIESDNMALHRSVEHFLRNQPRQREVTPNLSTLLSQLWEASKSKTRIASTVESVVVAFRDWLPMEQLQPLLGSLVVECCTVQNVLNLNSQPLPLPKDFAGDLDELRTWAKTMTSIARKGRPIAAVLDQDMVTATLLSLYLHYNLLLCSLTTCRSSSTATWLLDASSLETLRSMSWFVGFLEALTSDPTSRKQQLSPALLAVVQMSVELEASGPLSIEHKMSPVVAIFKKIQSSLNSFHFQMHPMKSTGIKREVFFDSIVSFCQRQTVPLERRWAESVVQQCRSISSEDGLSRCWISALFRYFTPSISVSNFLQGFHRHLVVYDIASQKQCLVDLLLSEIEKEDRSYKSAVAVAACIIQMSPAPSIFQGATSPHETLARAFSVFSSMALYSETIYQIVIGVAVSLCGDKAKLPALKKSTESVREYLLQAIRTGRISWFRSWHEQIASSLASTCMNGTILWWREATLDLLTCSCSTSCGLRHEWTARTLEGSATCRKRPSSNTETVDIFNGKRCRSGCEPITPFRRLKIESTSAHNGSEDTNIGADVTIKAMIHETDNDHLFSDDEFIRAHQNDSVSKDEDDSNGSDEILLLDL